MAGADGGRPRTARGVGILFGTGFWVPLTVCTYLAVVPDPPEHPVFDVSDVVLHAAAFTYLTLAFALTRYGRDPRLYARAFVVMLAYGLLLEAVQSLVPERNAELKDLVVDLFGIGFGLALAHLTAKPIFETASRLLVRV